MADDAQQAAADLLQAAANQAANQAHGGGGQAPVPANLVAAAGAAAAPGPGVQPRWWLSPLLRQLHMFKSRCRRRVSLRGWFFPSNKVRRMSSRADISLRPPTLSKELR